MNTVVAEAGGSTQQLNMQVQGARLAKPSENEHPAVVAGWWLHNERIDREASIAEVSLATRVDVAHLNAIETGQLDQLPERGRALDMIWAYADYLKLEPGPLCVHFGRLLPRSAPKQLEVPQISKFNTAGMMARFAFPKIANGPMIGAAFACFMAFGAFFFMLLPGSESTEGNPMMTEALDEADLITGTVRGLPDAGSKNSSSVAMNGSAEPEQSLSGLTELIAKTVPDVDKQTQVKAKTAPEKKTVKTSPKVERVDRKITTAKETGGRLYGAENKNSRLQIEAQARVWVRIEDNSGNVVFNQTLLSGDVFKVPNRKGLVLIARDGGALSYRLDGRKKGQIGVQGEILVGHPLDPEKIGQVS